LELPPGIEGTGDAVAVPLAPALAELPPASMSSPVPEKLFSTVLSSPSTIVSFVALASL
jgi:hypothetical protein